VSVYAPSELIDQTEYALNISTVVLDYYESYYGIKYPLHKSGEIAVHAISLIVHFKIGPQEVQLYVCVV